MSFTRSRSAARLQQRQRWSTRELWAFLGVLVLALVLPSPLGAQQSTSVRAARDAVDAPTGTDLHIPPLPGHYVRVHRGALTIAYPPSIETQVRSTLDRAERDARAVAAQLGLGALPPIEVRLVPDPDTMRSLAPAEAPPPTYAVGVAYPALRLTLVSASAPASWEAADMPRVLRHELAHLLLAIATRDAPVPRWFSEGVAIEQASEHSFERFKTLAIASFTRALLPLARLDNAFNEGPDRVEVAYAESADFVAYLMRVQGTGRFPVLIAHLREGVPFEEALRRTYDKSIRQLENEWREELETRFLTAPLWAGGSLLWLGGAALLVAAVLRHRRRSKATLARWAREEAALEQVRLLVVTPGATLDESLKATPTPSPHEGSEPTKNPEAPPSTDIDRERHTLH